MRRNMIAAAAALCLLLGGCAKSRIGVEDLDFQLDCKANVHYSGGSVTCSFQRLGPENAALEILSGGPEGLCWNWNGDGFTATFQGLAAGGKDCVLPQDSFAAVMVHTLDQAEKPGSLIPTHDNEFSGNAGYDYTLTADPETGKIKTLSVPDCNVTVDFYDYAEKTIEVDLNLAPEPD
ncbi:hypothetical protein CAFE_13420 [Caprobacter fermentans]|uniref:Lipoprotein n=1 Tax=Caproicibacter fermentans TaxID=2576756 RepID=A0A6N8HXU2_9FIRM|nr:hypothetical protein [Caproicibacter fermentans]MVB10646.1 hypothetical protein [Caproicibacter fermentans]OCN03257.1 hypothetical protein A7X67_12930 [Clostridium sp. W14A]QNK40921.1 hypothetical protein HCR03_00910 [Caproicibacter fermentans]